VLNLDFKAAKAGFFDSAKVLKAVDKATRRVLSRFGAFVRRRAQTSIRKRKGVSPPGGPPYGHAGQLRKFLFFSYDTDRKSVVIGPARLGGTVDPRALPALEYGGPSTGEDPRTGDRRTIRVRARPFMGPAFEAELPGLEGMWRDSVR
jgi:hypothetical protein